VKKIAVILSGCGVMDGSEIHESVLTLLHLQKANVAAQCVAPDMPMAEVVNHLNETKMNESRNVLVEAARIARGNIKSLGEVDAADFDGAILPGGYGAVKNLCNFAEKGENFEIHPQVEKFLKGLIAAKKPVGFICVAPVMIAKLYPKGVELTVGKDKGIADKLSKLGAKHIEVGVTNIVIDNRYKVVSTPAYMLAKNIAEADKGISLLVEEVVLWAEGHQAK